jgi:hypothetical protein
MDCRSRSPICCSAALSERWLMAAFRSTRPALFPKVGTAVVGTRRAARYQVARRPTILCRTAHYQIRYDAQLVYDKVQHLPFTYHDGSQMRTRAITDIDTLRNFFSARVDRYPSTCVLGIGVVEPGGRRRAFAVRLKSIAVRMGPHSTEALDDAHGAYVTKASNLLEENVIGMQISARFQRRQAEAALGYDLDQKLYVDRVGNSCQKSIRLPFSAIGSDHRAR